MTINLWYLNGKPATGNYGIYAFDNDGYPLSNSPIITAPSGATEIAWPTAVKIGSIITLWAGTYNGTLWNKIRRYTSTDGINFTDQGDIFTANGNELYGIGPSQILYDPSLANPYVLYYLIRDAGGAGTIIATATSSDGITWTRIGTVLTASGSDEAGGIAPAFPTKKQDGTYVLSYHGYLSGLNNGVAKIATCSTATGTFGNKVQIMSYDGFSSTLSSNAGEMNATVQSGVTVPLGIPIVVLSPQETLTAIKQLGTTILFDRPFSGTHVADSFYSNAARKVEASYIEEQAGGGWKGIFTCYGPAAGVLSELTTSASCATLTGTWTFTGDGLRFKPWINGGLVSCENPAPLLEFEGNKAMKKQDGRLTLTSGVPVTTSDVLAATTVYFSPDGGNEIELYSGGSWSTLTFSEISDSLSGATSGKGYDYFAYNNSGSVAIEKLVWTNDSTRATALARQDGVLVKSGDATRRYIGSIYTTVSGQTEDSKAKRFLFNYYNRRKRELKRCETSNSWTYSTAAWRQANANSANQVEVMVGFSEDMIDINLLTSAENSTSTARTCYSTIGLDSTNGSSVFSFAGSQEVTNNKLNFTNIGGGFLAEGKHSLTWLEYGGGADTQTWDGGAAIGLKGSCWA